MIPDDGTMEYGRRMMTALLGVDALCRAEGGEEAALAVVNMDTAGEFGPESFAGWREARERFGELRNEAAGLPEPDRRIYYDRLCHSTLSLIRWHQEGLSFESQLRNFLYVPAEPAPESALERLRRGMHDLLDRMGYCGDLPSQCAAWEERNRVLPQDVPEVTRNLMDGAWERTESRLLEIPAPRSDGMKVVPVSGVSFNARCNYLERRIELNTDPVLTRPGLKHLTAHEGCPGHYLQFKLRETMYRNGTAPADVLLSVVNSASSSVFEGIGDTGLRMLDWCGTDDDRLQSLMNRYRAGIGTGAAWRLHAMGRPVEEVTDWLRSRSLTGGDGWVANRMGFVSAPSRAVLIWSYWWGEQVVAPAWERLSPEDRPDFLRYLYGRMHSNETVAMFARRSRHGV